MQKPDVIVAIPRQTQYTTPVGEELGVTRPANSTTLRPTLDKRKNHLVSRHHFVETKCYDEQLKITKLAVENGKTNRPIVICNFESARTEADSISESF